MFQNDRFVNGNGRVNRFGACLYEKFRPSRLLSRQRRFKRNPKPTSCLLMMRSTGQKNPLKSFLHTLTHDIQAIPY